MRTGALRSTRADGVADDLRSRIGSGELRPGTALRETELEAHYAVSRHTVRRALALLVAERLASSRPYSGVTVADVDVAGLEALQQLRCALETEAVRLLRSRHGTDWPRSVTDPIDAAIAGLERACAAPEDWPGVERAHSRVHTALVAAAESDRITQAYVALDAELRVFLGRLRPELDTARLAADHRELVAAARTEGPEVVRVHLDVSTALLTHAFDAARHAPDVTNAVTPGEG